MSTIEIPISDFFRKDNASLVELLRIVQKAGRDGITTRKLCELTFDSRSHGMRVIKRAEKEGYIKRLGKNKRGYIKTNYLTPAGIALLKKLEKKKDGSTAARPRR